MLFEPWEKRQNFELGAGTIKIHQYADKDVLVANEEKELLLMIDHLI